MRCSFSMGSPRVFFVAQGVQRDLNPRIHRTKSEPAVGLEPTWSALRGRCPACRASPAYCSQPVLVSSQLDRGSEPQSPAEGLARSRSCRSRTCQPGFVDPALGAARQPTVLHTRVELANRPSESQ